MSAMRRHIPAAPPEAEGRFVIVASSSRPRLHPVILSVGSGTASGRCRGRIIPSNYCGRETARSGMTFRASSSASGSANMKQAPLDDDVQAADLLQEYEAKIAVLERRSTGS